MGFVANKLYCHMPQKIPPMTEALSWVVKKYPQNQCPWTCLQLVKYLVLYFDQKVRASPSFLH